MNRRFGNRNLIGFMLLFSSLAALPLLVNAQGRGNDDSRRGNEQSGKNDRGKKQGQEDRSSGGQRRDNDRGNDRGNGGGARDGDGATVPPTLPAVQQYFRALPRWPDAFLATPTEQPLGQSFSQEPVGSVVYDVQHQRMSMKSTPQEIVLFDPADSFWLGALLQESGLRQGLATQQEIPVPPEKRMPLNLTNDLLLDGKAVRVNKPSKSSVQEALANMINRGMAAGKKAKGDDFAGAFTAQVVENMSSEQTAVSLGLNIKYLGNSVKAKLASKRSATQRTLTILCIQKAFTVQTDLQGRQGAEPFLNGQFSEADLAALTKANLVGPSNRPVYVQSISYGRMILFSLTTTRDVSSLKGQLQASLNLAGKNGVALDAAASQLLSDASTQLEVVAVGGPQESAAALIRSGKLADFFKADVPLNTLRPIAYTIRTVQDNELAAMLQTTEYDLTNYQARVASEQPRYRVTAYFRISNSQDGAGDNTLECFGELRINNTKVWEIPAMAAEQNKKRSGETIDISIVIPGSRPTVYYSTTAATVNLQGFLKDSDKALNGADDTLYSFNLNVSLATLAGKGDQVYRGPAAELHLLVEREGGPANTRP